MAQIILSMNEIGNPTSGFNLLCKTSSQSLCHGHNTDGLSAMNLENTSIADWMASPSPGARHILLIDPDKQEPEIAAQRAMVAVDLGSSMIFVGGSTDTPFEKVEATCAAIQESFELRIFAESQKPDGDEQKWNVPVVLFPSGANALAKSADGITFMMLMNSSDSRFLIGEQAKGAPLTSNQFRWDTSFVPPEEKWVRLVGHTSFMRAKSNVSLNTRPLQKCMVLQPSILKRAVGQANLFHKASSVQQESPVTLSSLSEAAFEPKRMQSMQSKQVRILL
ncbi:MAG: hypothetical protein O2866_04495 [archaeon]|nr:hypothetical protein [archaeon]